MRAPAILSLLRAIAQDRQDLDPTVFSDSEISWILDRGLGPLLHRATALSSPRPQTTTQRSALRAADLTARVVNGTLLDALAQVLDATRAYSPSVTLLKGISVCQDIYERPHLRPMGDIDLLVDVDHQHKLEQSLRELGYLQRSEFSPEFYATHHHSMPFFHREFPVCIEVHKTLFPLITMVGRDSIFSNDFVGRNRIATVIDNREVYRLRPELQLPYICSHMAEHLTFSREPTAFIDLILLLRKYGGTLDWDLLMSSLDGNVAAVHTHLLLSYLTHYDLIAIPDDVMHRLKRSQPAPSPLITAIRHQLISRFLLSPQSFSRPFTSWNVKIVWNTLLRPWHPLANLAALPWNLLFPPDYPERYAWRFHLNRIRSVLTRH